MTVQGPIEILRPFRIPKSIRHRWCSEAHGIDDREIKKVSLSPDRSAIPGYVAYSGSVALEGEGGDFTEICAGTAIGRAEKTPFATLLDRVKGSAWTDPSKLSLREKLEQGQGPKSISVLDNTTLQIRCFESGRNQIRIPSEAEFVL
jgi:hypothetical protein